jgi:predicted dehydrogenase
MQRMSVDRLPVPGRVGLIGAGGFGAFCLNAYRGAGDIEVVAIADPRLSGTALPSHPDVPIAADWHAVIDDPTVEVVHIATPPSLRSALAVPALRAGKSVLVEKPLALSLMEADEILAAERVSGHAVGIDYVMRHHPAFQILERIAGDGVIGNLRTFSLQNFAQALPVDHWMWNEDVSGGILVEHGVHFFDAYGRIAGSPTCIRGNSPRREAVQVSVSYEGGAFGHFYHEFAFPQTVERTVGTVFFQRGYIEIDGWIPERLPGKLLADSERIASIVGDSGRVRIDQDGEVCSFSVEFENRGTAYGDAIVRGMRDLVATHRHPEHTMRVSSADARSSLRLALAGRQAARTGLAVGLEAECGVGHEGM